MTIDEMRDRKAELGLTNEMIAQASGVPLSTIQKILSGQTKAPRKNTLEAIEQVLYVEGSHRANSIYLEEKCEQNPSLSGVLRESGAAYRVPDPTEKKPGEYTLDDYYALPDERRVELIDGVFYDMSAPAVIHQKILGELYLLFRECIDAHGQDCEVYLSPCDVRLDCDNKTMVQPDLLVICRNYDLGAKAFEGAPDLTLEILSQETRAKDMTLKLYKYQNAGVREYWIVDPEKSVVLVYDLQGGEFAPEKYSFDDSIPIRISGGDCSIDFSRVNSALEKTRSRQQQQ